MIGIIAGQGAVGVTESDRLAWREANDAGMEEELDEETLDTMAHDILTVKCAYLCRQMFGQRSSRHRPEWSVTLP